MKFLREEFGLEESREEGEGFTTEVEVVFKERVAKPRRYPDVLVWFNKKAHLDKPWVDFDGVLIEIEPYGAKLDAKGAGINQVKEWLSYTPIGSIFVGIATNLREWWVVYFDNTTRDFIEHKFTTESFVNWLTHILGQGGKSFSREFREKQAEVITDRFYDHYYAILFGGEFRNREGKKVSIRKEDSLVENIYLKDLPERAVSEEDKIEYARLFLTRMMFIKILMDRGIIRDDLFKVLRSKGKEELLFHIEQLFFRVFNTPPQRRRGLLPEFKDLPYLNGGLFAYQNIGDRGISEIHFGIPPEQVEMVMEFLEQYSFTREEADVAGAISPEILGYVFEKTISNRKETGAYYTPRKITRYIAEETIKGYLLDIINKKLREKGWETLDSVEEFLEGGYDPKLAKTVLEELENIRVLDPAVGSGAFLLSAGEVILDLYRKLHKKANGNEPDTYEVKKHIVQHNLFGVDINRSAVEIAKLRLWLWIMEDVNRPEDVKPLPNIDYNLLAGNSLIGYLDDIPNQTTQLTILKAKIGDKLQQLSVAYPEVYRILEERLIAKATATLKELIELRKMLIEEYYSERDPIAQSLLKPIIDDISKAIREQFDSNYFGYLKRKLKGKLKPVELKAQHSLHWALEFPEVFLNGKGGFDIVIGNPPYVRQEELKEQKKFFQVEYKEIYNSTNDLSVYFVERSLKLVHEGGYHSFIITNKWTRTGYGKKLRNWLRDNFRILQIINFDDMEVFKEVGKRYATTYVLIYIIKREKPTQGNEFVFVPVNTIAKSIDEISDLWSIVSAYGYKIPQESLDEKAWSFGNRIEEEIKRWIEKVGTSLTSLDVTIYFGIKTGDNNAFVMDDKTRKNLIEKNPESADFFKPVLRGRDIGRYHYRWKKTWLLRIPAGFTKKLANKPALKEEEAAKIFRSRYPAIYDYLKEIGEEEIKKQEGQKKKKRGLFNRDDQGDFWWELRPCEYYEEFDKPKIVWLTLPANEPKFVWDVNGMYILNLSYMAVGSDVNKALLLIWNSKLSWFAMGLYSVSMTGNTIKYERALLQRLPVVLPDDSDKWVYETIADYLLFLSSDDEPKEKHRKELQFLDELGNLLVLELYFREKFQNDGVYQGLPLLRDIVKKYLQTIDYDEYAKLHYSIEPLDVQQSARLSQLRDQNLKTIRSVVAKLLQDQDTLNLVGKMKAHKWSKTVLSI
ncbi:Eco57I restriction-modification methylase domain-containing protein [Thermococcus sp.]